MLWESADPAAALTSRFGFVGEDHAAAWLTDALRDAWGLRVERCDRLVISASKLLAWLTVDGRCLIAKCAVDPTLFARLAEIDELIAWLHHEGLPVAAPLATTDGPRRLDRDRYSVGLYPAIGGDLLDVDDQDQVEAAGQTLATLHRSLAAYPGELSGGRAQEGQQLVHGDFRSANILYADQITAILDFDEASHRSRADELARSAVLLSTRYHNWQPTPPATRKAFVAAYNDVWPLTGMEWKEYDRVVAAVAKHFGWT